MNMTVSIVLAAALAVILALALQAALYFSRNIKRVLTEVSVNLKSINSDLNDHLKHNLTFINQANTQISGRLDNASRVIGDVKQHLGKLEESNKRLYEIGKDISSLQDLLRAPKMRGGIGEYILADLLRQILPQEYFILQYEFSSKERVDAVIKFGEGLVPVDAKFPLENFKKMTAQDDKDAKSSARKLFASDIKNHIKKISEKYIVPAEGTFDFALMYIPAENVYYEVIIKDEKISEESGLFHYSINKKVIPVSPNSFYAYLKVILLGLKGMAIEKSAKEILFNISHLKTGFDRFSTDFSKIGRHIDNAKSSYSESEKRLIKITDRLVHIESLDASKKRIES